MPGVMLEPFSGRVALYSRNFWHVTEVLIQLVIAVSFVAYLGKIMPQFLIGGISIIALVGFNLVLAIFNAALPPERPEIYRFFLSLLTILTSDREHDDPGLQGHIWNPVVIDEDAASYTSSHISNNKSGGALFHDSKGRLYIPGTGNIGMLYGPGIPILAIQAIDFPARAAEVDKGGLDFSVIPVRVPYALVWYSIYDVINAMDGYKGGDEIDKCFIWLLVSLRLLELSSPSFRARPS